MAATGQLRGRVTFQARQKIDDGYGNEVSGPWQDQFTVAANIAPARGREEVLAQRLQGVRPVEITVRWSSQTILVQPDWRAVNTRKPDEVYNIHDIRDPDGRKQWEHSHVQPGSGDLMPRVTFTRDFDFRPRPGVVIAHKAGRTYLATTPAARAAVEAGAATYVESAEPGAARPQAGGNPGRSAKGHSRRSQAKRPGNHGDAKAPGAKEDGGSNE